MPIEPPKIFISHSWDNKPLVRRLEAELKAVGAGVWVDHAGVRGGDNLPKEISAALVWCNTVVLVWSQSAAQSHWVELEWTNAIALRKLLIPCRLDKTALPALLSNLLYLDFTEIETGITQLREAVQLAQKPITNTPTSNTERVARFLRFDLAGDLPAIWNVPHHRNPNFTGRSQLLADLRLALTAEKTAALTQTQAVHGLGGVGKTQLALEYAYRYAADYRLVWWLRTEEPTTLAADYADLATALDLPEKEAQEQSAIIKAVRHWLDHHTGWLLIFDNASQAQDLLPYLPQAPTGHVIITSRHPHWKGVANPLRVPVWPREESVAFLMRRTGAQSEAMAVAEAAAVAEELGDLPLALEQASAYVEATGISWADYLDLFRQYRQDLLKEHQPLAYDATVATTWEISLQKVKAEAPAAVDLLKLCAFLAPDEIPRRLLIEGRKHLPEALAQTLAQPLVMNKAIASLVRYSLIEATNETLSLHRLVQAVTRDRLTEDEQKVWAQAAFQTVVRAWPSGNFDVRSWPECSRLLPHSYAVVEHVEKLKIESTDLAALLNRMGFYLHDRAFYSAAEPLYRRALEIRETQLGPDHPDTATSLNNLAGLLETQGQYATAEPLYRRALEIKEKLLGRDHPQVATGLNNLAGLLHAQGQYAAAELLHRRALEIDEKAYGPNHPDVAIDLNNLAESLRAQGQYAPAEPLYRRALEIKEKLLGRDHPQVATSLNSLALLLKSQGKYVEAEPLYRRSLKIREQQLGSDHPDVSQSLNNLATLLREQGKILETEPLYRRALRILEKQLGPDHPDTGVSYGNLAGVLEDQGKYAEAEPLRRKALKIHEKQFGADHPYIATGLDNLAWLLKTQGKYAEAEPLFRRALEIKEKLLGRDHPQVATSLNSLALLLEAQGQYAAAESIFRRAIAIFEKALGPEHPHTKTVRKNLEILLSEHSQK